MNYYHIRTYTPFCGEEADVYIVAKTEEEYIRKASDAAWENGNEWLDEDEWLDYHHDDENSIDDYYAECGWYFIAMITKEEYNKLNVEGEWCV